MCAKELQYYLNENPVVEPNTPRTRTLIVVGDSKGCRLQNIVQNIEPEQVEFVTNNYAQKIFQLINV